MKGKLPTLPEILAVPEPDEFHPCLDCGNQTPLSANSIVPGTGVFCGLCRRKRRIQVKEAS